MKNVLRALLLCGIAGVSYGSSLIGNVTVTALYPDAATVYAADTMAVGTSLSCPSASPLCTYFVQAATITITGSTITVNEDCCTAFTGAAFNGYSFSGLTFDDGGSLSNVTLTSSEIDPLDISNVTFTADSVFINLQGADLGGANAEPGIFTLTLTDSAAAVPEPGTFALLGISLVGVATMIRRRRSL
jgi:hypothetical protein